MATCPNKSHPDWRTLVESIGEDKAIEEYIRNGFEIPQIQGTKNEIVYDIDGVKFDAVTTSTNLNEAPEIASEIIDKLNQQYPSVNVYKDGLFDTNGRWIKIPPGKDGMHLRNSFIGAVAWSNASKLETVPHEYAHDYIEVFQEHPLMRKAINAYGIEGLAQKMGKDYVNNVLSKNERTLVEKIWDLIKSFFSTEEVGDIISRNFYKGVEMSNIVHEGTNIYNYNTIKAPQKRKNRTDGIDSQRQFDGKSTKATMIDYERSVDLILTQLNGGKVFKNIETVLEFESQGFVEKEVVKGDPDFSRAGHVFQHMINLIIKADRGPDGKYANVSGISTSILSNLEKRLLNKEGHVKEIIEILKEEKPLPPQDNSTELAQDYWALVRIMQKLNYLSKSKQSILVDGDNFVSKELIKEKVENEIKKIHDIRTEAINKKFKGKRMRKFIHGTRKQMNKYFITPYLTSKFLAGEESFLSKMYYESLNNADTNKLRIKQQFVADLKITEELSKEMGVFSSFLFRKVDISKYKGKEFVLNTADGQSKKIKLTDGELISLYLTLKRTGNQAIYPDSNSPSMALRKYGFHLEQIKGRESYSKVNYQFTKNTSQEIINHIEGNSAYMKYISNVDSALKNLYIPVNETFQKQNGFTLPQYENYFPVSTYAGAFDLKKQKNNIENLSSIRDSVGSEQPLRIADVSKVLAFHSNNSSSYAAYAIPIDNNKKIVKMLKNEFHGSKENEIIYQFLEQMEGKMNSLNDPSVLATSRGEEDLAKLSNKSFSNFAVSALAWNVGVMTKQPISYLAAKELINVKYLKKAGWGIGGITGVNPGQIFRNLKYVGVKSGETVLPVEWSMDLKNQTYLDIIKHSPKLVARFAGAVSKETGEALFDKEFGGDEWITPFSKKDGSRVGISKSRLMKGIQIFDAATVMSIWKAVEAETNEIHPNLKKGSNEYFEHISVRTEHIVNMTQPTFDLMNRTELASMSHPMARMFSMFGSAKSKLGALMIEGAYDAIMNPTKINKKKFRSRAVNLALLNGLGLAAANALFGFKFPDDDDDDGLFDDLLSFTSTEVIKGATGQFYGLGQLTEGILNSIDNKPWADKTVQYPIFQVLNRLPGVLHDIVRVGKEDKRNGDWIWTIDDGFLDALDIVPKFLGLPSSPMNYSKKVYRYFDEKDEN